MQPFNFNSYLKNNPLLNEEVYQDRPFTKKLYDECTMLGIVWEDMSTGNFPIRVQNKRGKEAFLKIDEKRKTIDAVVQGYKQDIYEFEIGKSGQDIADFLSSLTSKWFRDNDPDWHRW